MFYKISSVSYFFYVSFTDQVSLLSVTCQSEDTNINLNTFQRMCGSISRTVRQKSMQIKTYQVMTMPVCNYSCKNWTVNKSDKR
jgi:hypothetical protein